MPYLLRVMHKLLFGGVEVQPKAVKRVWACAAHVQMTFGTLQRSARWHCSLNERGIEEKERWRLWPIPSYNSTQLQSLLNQRFKSKRQNLLGTKLRILNGKKVQTRSFMASKAGWEKVANRALGSDCSSIWSLASPLKNSIRPKSFAVRPSDPPLSTEHLHEESEDGVLEGL